MHPLESNIGYKFRNALLLAEALTHPSISSERKSFPFDNQRLEFLGDAVLQLAITVHCYTLFPSFSEGKLTKLRAKVVSRNNLKDYAIALGLGTYLMMGYGEEVNAGRTRHSTLADTFESLVGALYLDGGFEQAYKFILQQMQSNFVRLLQDTEEFNPKGKLQEILQAITPFTPKYVILDQSTPESKQKCFRCSVIWEQREIGHGIGGSKKKAEVAAAHAALNNRTWEYFSSSD